MQTTPSNKVAGHDDCTAGSAPSKPDSDAAKSRIPVRSWLQPAVIALIVVSAFIGCYVGLQRHPMPHHVPVAVVGSNLSDQVQHALGGSVDTHSAAPAAAHAELEHRDVVAVLSQAGPGQLSLQVAGANGLSTTTAVENLAFAYAHGSGQSLTIADDVPLARYDSRGMAGFYVAFGVSLAGSVLAQNTLGLVQLLRLRHRFTLIVGCAIAIGLIGATLAGPVMGAVPAPFLPLALTLALLAAAAGFATKLLGSLFGSVGIPMATLLLLTVGNSTSGATIGADLLPGAAHAVSAVLPPGAAVRAITDLTYFHGAHATGPLVVLLLWAVVCATSVWVRDVFHSSRRSVPPFSETLPSANPATATPA